MPLIDDIRRLGDDTLAALDASHNYYTHTKLAWRAVQKLAQDGRSITFRNLDTGDILDAAQLPSRAQRYVSGHLAYSTLQEFVSLFEGFVADFVRLWLNEFPASLSGREVKFQTVLSAPDKAAVVRAVIERELVDVTYGRVSGWFDYIGKLVKLGCPSQEQVLRLAEVKASRDVLVHNKGAINRTYLQKAGDLSRFADGQRIEVSEGYHRQSWSLIRQIVTDMTDAAIARLTPKQLP